MEKTYSGVRGTTDFTPEKAKLFNKLANNARGVFSRFGYEEIMLPLLEEEGLFVRGVGDTSDIAEKQLFRIADKDGICLRPEGTAQVVRYFLENSLHRLGDFYKFSYIGPMFRGERPQKGRLRQFHHFGAEALGGVSPYLDAETIYLAVSLLDSFGITQKEVKINTLGCVQDKSRFCELLKNSLLEKASSLCDDCKRRLMKNPLRVLDCKNHACRQAVADLKMDGQNLCDDCKSHFDTVLSALDKLGVKYTRDPYLVRGLDYYTHTVFEITSSSLGSQDAIGAGGRYNRLIENLGGPEFPAVGFALGVERVMLALGEQKCEPDFNVFVAAFDTQRVLAMDILQKLRNGGINADTDYCNKSIKAQMRLAQRKGARFVAVIGDDEAKEHCVMLKDMQKNEQTKVSIDRLVETIKEKAI